MRRLEAGLEKWACWRFELSFQLGPEQRCVHYNVSFQDLLVFLTSGMCTPSPGWRDLDWQLLLSVRDMVGGAVCCLGVCPAGLVSGLCVSDEGHQYGSCMASARLQTDSCEARSAVPQRIQRLMQANLARGINVTAASASTMMIPGYVRPSLPLLMAGAGAAAPSVPGTCLLTASRQQKLLTLTAALTGGARPTCQLLGHPKT